MGRQVTLFSGYSQGENGTTNYCLLMLRMLYEENPKFLGQVLATLAGEDAGDQVGVQFRQQERKGTSVPDGLIFQPAFTLFGARCERAPRANSSAPFAESTPPHAAVSDSGQNPMTCA